MMGITHEGHKRVYWGMPRYLSYTVLVLSVISFLADLSSEMLYPIMPEFLKGVGVGALGIGLIDGGASMVAGLGKVYFGSWSDAVDRRLPFVRWGYFLSAVTKPLMGLFPYIGAVTGARALDRLGKGIRTAARDAMLVGGSLPEDRGKVFGFHRSMDTLGAVVGPLVALAYLARWPGEYEGMFLVAFVPGILAVGVSMLLREEKKAGKARVGMGTPFKGIFQFWKVADKDYKRLLLGVLGFSLLNSSDLLLLLRAGEVGLSPREVIGCYVLYNVVYAVASWPLGGLGDRIGFKPVFVGSLVVFGVCYAAMGWGEQREIVWGVFALYGCFTAAHEGIAKSWLTLHIPKESKATGLGLYQFLNTLALFVASSWAGLAWTLSSGELTFWVTGLAALGVAVAFWVLMPATSVRKIP